MTSPDTCPNCGADVPTGARACPECGADEQTGWSERAHYENLGIPDDSFDYDEWIKREFETESPDEKRRRFWRIIGIVLLLLLAFPVLYWALIAILGAR